MGGRKTSFAIAPQYLSSKSELKLSPITSTRPHPHLELIQFYIYKSTEVSDMSKVRNCFRVPFPPRGDPFSESSTATTKTTAQN